MKLDQFVKQTLLDITNGVAQAQAEAKLWISPGKVEGKPNNTPQMVSFEVAVTVNKEGSGGISVWSIGEFKGLRRPRASTVFRLKCLCIFRRRPRFTRNTRKPIRFLRPRRKAKQNDHSHQKRHHRYR
ncbi:MAG: hypothetical protein IPL38_18965 [Rhodobacter sp.]|nr:hypothetical protein [Rhodobacter sp.]